jgi:flagellar assembly protein FliH
VEAFLLPALEPLPPPPADGGAPVVPAVPQVDLEAEAAAAREAGFAAGMADAVAALQPAHDALTAAAAALEAERATAAGELEALAVDLGLQIAEQVLAGALDAQPERVVDVVRGALRRLLDRERVTVLVAPDDLELLRAAAPELVAELGGIEHLEVQAERRVSRGGAIVRTPEGEVDATLATKLARVREVVADALAP